MLGAIYGDKAGSIYEFEQLKEITSINPKELILPNSFYSDDTIETIAVIDAIINNKDYEQTLRKYILDNILKRLFLQMLLNGQKELEEMTVLEMEL